MKVGQIVRRKNGWTPMRVIYADRLTVVAGYCGSSCAEPEPYNPGELVVVRGPAEFAKCPGWMNLMTENDMHQLTQQGLDKKYGAPNPGGDEDAIEEEEPMARKLYQTKKDLSLIHISEPTRRHHVSRMPSSA